MVDSDGNGHVLVIEDIKGRGDDEKLYNHNHTSSWRMSSSPTSSKFRAFPLSDRQRLSSFDLSRYHAPYQWPSPHDHRSIAQTTKSNTKLPEMEVTAQLSRASDLPPNQMPSIERQPDVDAGIDNEVQSHKETNTEPQAPVSSTRTTGRAKFRDRNIYTNWERTIGSGPLSDPGVVGPRVVIGDLKVHAFDDGLQVWVAEDRSLSDSLEWVMAEHGYPHPNRDLDYFLCLNGGETPTWVTRATLSKYKSMKKGKRRNT
ncbi:hypothetical protein FRC02_005066 [Tulasnella sp. 418]|nr:hypothetical protein FRC02_005066 [Tulasnella sp. 418]